MGSNRVSDEPLPRTASPLHKSPVPRGSDAFQEALLQAYTDMKENKKREKSRIGEDDEDYSDEERDKCMDINLFRRFAISEHAQKLNPHFKGDRNNYAMKVPVRGVTTDHVTGLEKFSSLGFKQAPTGRRHSIATITPEVSARKSSFH